MAVLGTLQDRHPHLCAVPGRGIGVRHVPGSARLPSSLRLRQLLGGAVPVRGVRARRPHLRRLTRSNLELVLSGGEGPAPRCDPADLSFAVTAWIGSRFEGDRGRAEREALESVRAALGVVGMERWPEPERHSFRSLCLLLAMVPGLDRWPAADRRKAIALLRAKGAANEDTHFDLMRRHRRFRDAMAKIAAGIN